VSLLGRAGGNGRGEWLAVFAPGIRRHPSALPSRQALVPSPPACSPDAAEMYERVRGACCPYHGFGSDRSLDLHARLIARAVVEAWELAPRSQRGA
jgi:hypothetical protein